jgi:hypothetical protein
VTLTVYGRGGCGCGRKKNELIWSGIDRVMIVFVLDGGNVAVAVKKKKKKGGGRLGHKLTVPL